MNRWEILFRLLVVEIAIQASVGLLYADTRVAVVIGNEQYKDSPLDNPKNDATAMNTVLKQLGFRTTLLIDADADKIKRAVSDLSKVLQQGDATVGLFYYAGHGVQVEGKNYLIPLGATFQTKMDVLRLGVDASWVLDTMQSAKNKISIVILDACRDHPFEREKKGFAQMAGKAGALIAYSTAPGNIAKDGEGPHSPYTKHLKTFIAQKDSKIEDVFKNVRKKVQEETEDTQLPWELSALTSDYYPAGRSISRPLPPPPPPERKREEHPPPDLTDKEETHLPKTTSSEDIVPRLSTEPLPIKFDFSEAKEAGAAIVEDTLAEEFRLRGHKILDRSSKTKALLIKGNFQVTRSQGPGSWGPIAVSHADISARVVRDGNIIGSASAFPPGKPFNRTGGTAIEAAAHMLAVKLLDMIDSSKGK